MGHHVVGRQLVILGIVVDAIEAIRGSELGVFSDHDLSHEALRMIDNTADHSAQEIGVRATSLGPLVVDLDDNHIIPGQDAVGAGGRSRFGSLVELQAVAAQECQ